jgi:hypothetical protein
MCRDQTNFVLSSRNVVKILCLPIFGFYALIVASILNAHLNRGDGDITRYLQFFSDWGRDTAVNNFSLRGDGVFRIFISFVTDYFEIKALILLTIIVALNSIITLLLVLRNTINYQRFLLFIPILNMIYLTPNVLIFFSDQIRSSLALSLILIGLSIRNKGFKYLIFLVGSLTHFAMIPIIVLYFGFLIINRINMKPKTTLHITASILAAILLVQTSKELNFNITDVSQGIGFNILILYFMSVLFIYRKYLLNNYYGFIGVSLISVYVLGQIFGISFHRYIAMALIFISLHIVTQARYRDLLGFTLLYSPIFSILSVQKFLNVGI